MSKDLKFALILDGIIVALALGVCLQARNARHLRDERDRYRENMNAALTEAQQYKVRDSLNAARAEGLELTLKEYKRHHEDDAELIADMGLRLKDLSAVNAAQAQTIIELRATPKDIVVIRDSVAIPALKLHCGDAWYDFDGLLADGEFSGNLTSRDSLLVVESVRYRRFLGFLWRTRKVDARQIDVVSKNPHTRILDVEHTFIHN